MSKTRRVLLLLLILAVLRWPLDVLLAAMLPDASVNPVPQCVAGMLLSVVLLGVPAWMQHPWTSDRLTKQKSALPGFVAGLVMALLLRAAMSPVDAAWQQWLNLAPDALPVPESIPVAMLYILALTVVPAVMEEVFFRGALLTGLLDGSRRVTAFLLTSVTFALMHGSLANLPSLLLLSGGMTLLMLWSGNIAAPIVTHLVYNLTALNWPGMPLWGSGLCGAGLIALTVRLCIRQPRYAHQPMKRTDGLIAAASLIILAATYFV